MIDNWIHLFNGEQSWNSSGSFVHLSQVGTREEGMVRGEGEIMEDKDDK